ncbi:MAG: amino acid racemase [Caldisericia bacterium]|jgi:aspartate racemase|nr:amino acid racemase [Caldisericia bacterium]
MEIGERIIGVIGGMGPEATLDLFYKILKNTKAEKDQDHIHLIIDNYPQIPDRTMYLLGKGENPLPYILKSAKNLEMLGVSAICMPCNTAHYFVNEIKKEIKVPFLSIVDSVIEEIKENYKNIKNVGLIATEGTIIGKVYETPIKKEGLNIIIRKDLINDVMKIIYSIKGGKIKENIDLFNKIVEEYINSGSQVIIAGCTEIPLLFPYIEIKVPIIDSTLCLAKKVIKFAKGINKEP